MAKTGSWCILQLMAEMSPFYLTPTHSISHEQIIQPTMVGSFRSFNLQSRCCGRSPHCRHSPRVQRYEMVELTVCGQTSLPLRVYQCLVRQPLPRKVVLERSCWRSAQREERLEDIRCTKQRSRLCLDYPRRSPSPMDQRHVANLLVKCPRSEY